MEQQDGGEAIQHVRQGCEPQPVETSELLEQGRPTPEELPTAAATLTIVEVATGDATGTAPPAQVRPTPEELPTPRATLTIVEVATGDVAGTVPPAQPGPAT